MSLLFGQQPTPFNQSGGGGGGDMLKSVYDTNDDGIVDTAAAVSSGPGAGTIFDVTLDENGEAQIAVANADTKKVYGLSFNSQADFGGTPERFGEGDTDNINIRSTAGPAHAGRSVTGFYLSLMLMLFGAAGLLSPIFGQSATTTTFIDLKRQVAPANPGANFDRMWIGSDHQVRFQQPDGTVQFMPYYVSSLSGIPIATSGALTQFAAAPGGGDSAKFLRGDGTWASPASGFTLQTQTSFTNNSTPAIYLKAPNPSTTPFLQFLDGSDVSKLKVYYDGGIESAGDFYTATGKFATTGTSITLRTAGNTDVGVFREYGSLSFEGAVPSTSGVPKAWLDFNGTQNNTGITASTEYNAFWYNPSRTYTWATGGFTNQRFFYLRAPTLAFGGASTVTNAATFTISGAPIAGTNATLTNAYALWVASGQSQFDGNIALGSSNTLLLGGATTPTGSAVKLQIGTPATANNAVSLYIEPVASGYSAIAIQAQAGQSADLLHVANSSGAKIAAIGNKGSLWSSPAGVASTLVLGDSAGAALTGSLVNNTIIGSYAAMSLATGTGNVFIGNNAGYSDNNVTNSIIIGSYECDANNTATNGPFLAIGVAGGDEIAAANVAVFGSSTVPYNDWYFGRGYSGSTVTDITFQPTFATGADKAGADFFIRGGAGTGDGEPGTIQFQATSPLASGSTAQTQSTIATITYGGLELNAGRFLVPQIKGTGTTPSAVVGAGAGTGATVSVSGTDLAGQITITTGTLPSLDSDICTITFSSAMSSAPFTQIAPADSDAAQVAGTWYVTSTTTTFTITGLGVWPAGTEIKFNYFNPQ